MKCQTQSCNNEKLKVAVGTGNQSLLIVEELAFKFCDDCLYEKFKEMIKELQKKQ